MQRKSFFEKRLHCKARPANWQKRQPQAIEQPLDLALPKNKLMLAFYLAAPEVENDRRALNVLLGMRKAKKERRWMGVAPIGYANKITEDGKKYIALLNRKQV